MIDPYVTTNIQVGVLWKKSSESFKQNPWKIPKEKLCRFQKWIHSHVFFKVFAKNLSDLVHNFWEDCFLNQNRY